VGSHRLERKIYKLEVPRLLSVIAVGSAVQIKRSRLSSLYFNYLSRIPGHSACLCQNNE
jgi:ABC-type cobalamin transport system permease subunit